MFLTCCSPPIIEEVLGWFEDWVAFGRHGYIPDLLQTEFDIPVEAFNCSGPM